VLYKYVGNEDPLKAIDYLKRFVNDGTIKATAPRQFNDPAEFKVNFVFDATQDEKKGFVRRLWPGKKEEVYDDWVNNRAEHVENNDALRLRAALLQTAGVICLTLEPDNYLMWSHYAHSHSGFCIGFSDQVLNSLKTKDCVAHAYVEYEEKPPSVNFYNTDEEEVGRALFTYKSKVWEYEKEFRVIFRESGIRKLEISSIKEIVLGCRASDELEAYARTLIGSGIGIFKMRESISSYQLEKIELKDNVYF